MIKLAIISLVIAAVLALLGFGGAAGTFVGIAKILFFIALAVFVVAHILFFPVGMTLFSQLFTLARLAASVHPPEVRTGLLSAIRAAFAVRDGARARIEGARILLVDDVFTTGATLSACSLALRRAGAAHIGVVVLARVVRPSDVTI